MPAALKDLYNRQLISELGCSIKDHYADFDLQSFSAAVFDRHWQQRQLKQRMRHITICLQSHLPDDYQTAISILKPVAAGFTGVECLFFQDYVECYGLQQFEVSVAALAHFTRFSTAEFAVRAFILQQEKPMMKQMLRWAESEDHHLRRLASEGCRPRLPWAVSLPPFKKDPAPVLKVLKKLMRDDSEYVRRSVANNLNDISKDNPGIVVQWLRYWLHKNDSEKDPQVNRNTRRLLKHAARTLLKQGDQQVLALFGYGAGQHIEVTGLQLPASLRSGEELAFSFFLNSGQMALGKCRIEFAIDFVRANGCLSRKVFKIAESDYVQKQKQVTKSFSFRTITTRRYYSGRHQLVIIINGIEKKSAFFDLIL